jgi:putative spermidine/putrescine transport system ATP-binding protein
MAATPATPGTPAIRLTDVVKTFGAVTAVDGIDLAIADGEFFSMLGPSGSGKTTVLRMIAGFEHPTSGQVFLGGVDVSRRPPHARDVNTVFQDYALFPHMDVIGNVEYGLRVKKVGREERRRRAREALELVRLEGYDERRPNQLSGGQRQRVALARALVNRPRVLLLDEPLGALDLKLRREMQLSLKQIQREVGITFCFVTHDQEEALTMSDRIAVFNDGRIEQVATPAELYESPTSPFVAGFVGTSNLLTGAVARAIVGRDGTFSIRPEKIHLGSDGADVPVRASGVVQDVVYLGSVNHYLVGLDGGTTLTVLRQNLRGETHASMSRRGDRVDLAWDDAHLIDLTGGALAAGTATHEGEAI